MRLYISGGSHIHRNTDEREEEILAALNGQPDVIFEEASKDTGDDSGGWAEILSAPLIIVVLVSWTLLLRFSSTIFGSDRELKDRLYNEDNVQRVKVDHSLTPFISESRKLWAFANWIPILISVPLALTNLRVGLFFMFIFAAVISLSFIAATVAPRNYAIALNIMKANKHNQYDSGVLVVGNEHSEEIKNHIQSASTQIEIVDVPREE